MNKSGFIATSLLYSFFLLFCALILMFAINIGHNSILLNKEKDKINEDIHSNKRIMNAEAGSYFRLNVCVINNNTSSEQGLFNSANTMDYILFQNDDNGLGHFVAKNLSYKLNSLELLNEILNLVYVKNEQDKIASRSMSESDYNTIVSEEEGKKLDKNIKNIILNSDFDNDNEHEGKDSVKYLLANNSKNYYVDSKVYNVYLQNVEKISSQDITDDKIFVRLVFDINSLTKIVGGDGTLSNPYVLEGGASVCD